MPLVVTVLEKQLEDVFLANVPDATADQKTQITAMATAMSAAIDQYIKSATITVTAGIAVQVTVPAGTGATIAPGVGVIS